MEKKNFNEYLSVDTMITYVSGTDGWSVVEKLLELLKKKNPSLDEKKALQAVKERESLFSTVLADGMAVPHARIAGLPAPLVAIATSKKGMLFGEKTINLMVLVLSPLDDPNSHLQLLAALNKECAPAGALQRIVACNTPSELLTYFTNASLPIPDYLNAGDLMEKSFPCLHETDSMAQAIETFSKCGEEELPVLDAAGDLRGVVALTDLLRYCLPEHLLWMENLSPMYQFQPFQETLKTANESKVADLMREEFLQVSENTPAIHLAKLFLNENPKILIITSAGGKYAGVVTLRHFSLQVLWK